MVIYCVVHVVVNEMKIIYGLLLILGFIGLSISDLINQCEDDLLTKHGEFQASSHKKGVNNYRASDGRFLINHMSESLSKAWCPKHPVSPGTRSEWLEIDFKRFVSIRGLYTKGKQPNNFTRHIMIKYKRNGQWKNYENGTALAANSDSRTATTIRLKYLVTKKLRIHPVGTGNVAQEVCLAVGILGCYWNDFVTNYDMEDGDFNYEQDVKLRDRIYDGTRISVKQKSMLRGGLGSLMDNIYVGATKFNNEDVVGWKCSRPITITFNFSQYRIINFVSLYFALSPPKIVLPSSINLQLFPSKYKLHFANFTGSKVNLTLTHSPESLMGSISIQVTLKCIESLSESWIMPSEIRFQSVKPMLPTPKPPLKPTPGSNELGTKRNMYKTTESSPYNKKSQMLKDTTLLVIISLSIVVLLVLVFCVAFVLYKLYSSSSASSSSVCKASLSSYTNKKLHILQSPLPGSSSHSNLTVFPSHSSCLSVSIPHCNFPMQQPPNQHPPMFGLHPGKSGILSNSTDQLPSSSSLTHPNSGNCYSVLTTLPNSSARGSRQYHAPILKPSQYQHQQGVVGPPHGVYSGSTSRSSTTLGDSQQQQQQSQQHQQQGQPALPGDSSTNNTINPTLYSSWPNTADDEEDDSSDKAANDHCNGVSVKGLVGKSSQKVHKDIEHQRLLGNSTGHIPYLSGSVSSPLPPPPQQNHPHPHHNQQTNNSPNNYDYSTLKEYSLYQPDSNDTNNYPTFNQSGNGVPTTEDYSLLGTSFSHTSLSNPNQFPKNLIPMTSQYPIRMQYQPLHFSNHNKSPIDPPIRVDPALSNYLRQYRGVCGDVSYHPLLCSIPNCPIKPAKAKFETPFLQSETKDVKITNYHDSIISQSNSRVLCQGQYGSVLSIIPLTKNSNNNNVSGQFILKQLSQISTSTAKSDLLREMRGLCYLGCSCDNLVSLHSIVLHNSGSNIEAEIERGGFSLLLQSTNPGAISPIVNLKYFLRNSPADLNSNNPWILEQVLRALCHLHDSGFTHGDLGSRSCGIDPGSGHVKVYPGGCIEDACCKEDYVACIGCLDDGISDTVTMVPVRWLAPEVLRGEGESCTSDIWSLGVLSWELVTKCRLRPYSSLTDASLLGGMMASEASCPRLALPPSSPHAHFLSQCMQYESHNRPSATQLLHTK